MSTGEEPPRSGWSSVSECEVHAIVIKFLQTTTLRVVQKIRRKFLFLSLEFVLFLPAWIRCGRRRRVTPVHNDRNQAMLTPQHHVWNLIAVTVLPLPGTKT